jgi:hypothetical protein
VPACGDHLRVADRDPGDVLDADRLRIVGQYVALGRVGHTSRTVAQGGEAAAIELGGSPAPRRFKQQFHPGGSVPEG